MFGNKKVPNEKTVWDACARYHPNYRRSLSLDTYKAGVPRLIAEYSGSGKRRALLACTDREFSEKDDNAYSSVTVSIINLLYTNSFKNAIVFWKKAFI